MSKRTSLTSTCICGHAIEFTSLKPNRLTHTIAKATCACGSRYQFKCALGKDPRTIDVTASVLTLSSGAKESARKALRAKAGV